jgi:hypothetical protein
MDKTDGGEKPPESIAAFEGRDHIVVGIGRDELGPYWSTLGEMLAPVSFDSALKNREWYRENHPEWDVKIYRIEEVK